MRIKKIPLSFKLKRPVLALGSQTKNTVCFAKGYLAFFGCLHADLNDPKDFLSFEKEVKYFLKKRPEVIACDLHPEYASTKYASGLRPQASCLKAQPAACSLQPVQHHHAHIASCMAEQGIKNKKVIGVCFDGTGLGDNGSLWGAEFLVCDYRAFRRVAHLKEIPLIGGEQAIRQPWRLLAAWGLDRPKAVSKKDWDFIKSMRQKNFNSPLASSMGRLFDVAAVLILGGIRANFEAELAIALERTAVSCQVSGARCQVSGVRCEVSGARCQVSGGYKYRISKKKDGFIIDPMPVFKGMIRDLKKRAPKPEIAYRFHLSVAEMIGEACAILRKKYKINKVILSGGVFQNRLLLDLSRKLLEKEGFQTITHEKLSCNDSGISLGQAVIASFN